MKPRSSGRRRAGPTARIIRFPARLCSRLAADAERCGRSFEAQVLAILRRPFGEDIDIAPTPETIEALADRSLVGIPDADAALLTRRWRADEE